MKFFVLVGLGFLVLAIGATVIVFFVIRNYSLPTDREQLKENIGTKVEESLIDSKEEFASSTAAAIGDAGLPLKDLSIEGVQKKALEVAGIDTETFVITKDMLVCAEEKLGAERIAAFAAGEAPGVLEITKMIPCLGSR